MSQENVEVVRRWVEQLVMEGTYYGHDGLRRWWQDVVEPFASASKCWTTPRSMQSGS
jgi:hypothetical protein